jgi:hypothetical protein
MGEWKYSSTILDLGIRLELGGQLHSPAALPLGKELPVLIGYEAGWTPEPVGTLWIR